MFSRVNNKQQQRPQNETDINLDIRACLFVVCLLGFSPPHLPQIYGCHYPSPRVGSGHQPKQNIIQFARTGTRLKARS